MKTFRVWVGVFVALVFCLVAISSNTEAQQIAPNKRPNGDYYDYTVFRFGSHQAVAPAILDTLVGGDTSTATSNFYVYGADALFVEWTTASLNNMDSTFLAFQGSMSGQKWTDITGAIARDTAVTASSRAKILTTASFVSYPMIRAVISQKNQAGNTATDSTTVRVRLGALFKAR